MPRDLLPTLPCPFCGKQPQVFPTASGIHRGNCGDAWGEVRCVNARCPARPKVSDGATINDDRGSLAYRNQAIRRWNRRVS